MSNLSAQLEKLEDYLRNECRLKRNTDYAWTCKYGEVNILTSEIFLEIIQDACIEQGLEVKAFFTFEAP